MNKEKAVNPKPQPVVSAPQRPYFRVTALAWVSGKWCPAAWTFGGYEGESSIATALKKAGLM